MVCTELGFDCVVLHSMIRQKERLAALAKFKSNQVKILIATDVASRWVNGAFWVYMIVKTQLMCGVFFGVICGYCYQREQEIGNIKTGSEKFRENNMILKIVGTEKPPSCKWLPLYQEENPMFTI